MPDTGDRDRVGAGVGGWPRSEEDLPTTQPIEGVLRYDEGLLVGYRGYERRGPPPLYPFGHGLGYTSWTYLSIEAPAAGGWTLEPGVFQLAAGATSTELSPFSAIEIFRCDTSAEGRGCSPPDLFSARRTPGLSQRV